MEDPASPRCSAGEKGKCFTKDVCGSPDVRRNFRKAVKILLDPQSCSLPGCCSALYPKIPEKTYSIAQFYFKGQSLMRSSVYLLKQFYSPHIVHGDSKEQTFHLPLLTELGKPCS